jgi:hypothetical protein
MFSLYTMNVWVEPPGKITLGLKATSTNYSKSHETRATILNFKCGCALGFTVSFLLAEQSNLKLKTRP